MELTKRINFRQPKYMIPALVYFPLIFTGYFVIDMFGTKKAETVDPSMQTTEYLNPNLPQAKVKDDLDGKYESMLKSWGKIDDYSAVGNIDREDENAATETYERQVSEADAEAMEGNRGSMPPGSVEETLRRSASRGEAVAGGDYPFPLTESERLIQSQQREEALREELEAALAQLRAQSEASVTGSQATPQPQPGSSAVSTPSEDDGAAQVVKRIMQSSDYFHTVSENDPQPDLIKAIIDENIKAVDGSRVRLRLLDDVQVGSITMPKGSYLYAEMSGFSGQRVKGTVKSVLLYDEIIRVSLTLYDTDGLEGLYVPRSTFNETGRMSPAARWEAT